MTTRSKDNEAYERSYDPKKGGYALVCNSHGLTTRPKGERKSAERSGALGEWGMPQHVMMNKLRYKMPQNYCALKYAHPSCNENVQPRIGNAKQDHAS